MEVLSQPANDIVWDSTHGVLYASVPGSSTSHPNSIITIDPTAETPITAAQTLGGGSEPYVLAISDNDAYLYVGMDGLGTVQRFTLPALDSDISYDLGSSVSNGHYFALDLKVAPGAPKTTAVSLGANATPVARGGLAIFDDATRRTITLPGWNANLGNLYDTIEWGGSADTLYAANTEREGYEFFKIAVDSTGLSVTNTYQGLFSSYYPRIHFDPTTELIYSDEGLVVDPTTGTSDGSFHYSGWVIPDSEHGKAFMLIEGANSSNEPLLGVASFELSGDRNAHDVFWLENVAGTPLQFIRWGSDGLAFITDGGEMYFVRGPFVSDSLTTAAAQSGVAFRSARPLPLGERAAPARHHMPGR